MTDRIALPKHYTVSVGPGADVNGIGLSTYLAVDNHKPWAIDPDLEATIPDKDKMPVVFPLTSAAPATLHQLSDLQEFHYLLLASHGSHVESIGWPARIEVCRSFHSSD